MSSNVNPVVADGGNNSLQRNVFVRILEEPASKALRFRYECEGRSAGSLPGANSTQDKKSFPKIQVSGYRGRAVVVVSCVTIDPPYRPHPHNLVGKEGCKKGVCTMEIANDDMTCEFSNLGIQCVKKKDIEDSLKIMEEIRVDPFRTGFHHKSQPGSIDLNSLRLCFQVFLEGPERGQFKVPLKPVVSEAIYDKKAINDLTIMKLSDCTSPVMGNKEIILLCDKVSKDDIEVRFYEENEETGAVVWESFGDFQPSDVHKQYAICFRTPQYHNLEITNPSRVFIQLRCPSKDTTSAPRPFQYIPLLTSGSSSKRKWNLVSFSGAYGCYMTNSPNNKSDSFETDSPSKKVKPIDLEDILASDATRVNGVDNLTDEPPIYDRLNQFMGVNEVNSVSNSQVNGTSETNENIYDVDLDLISQIIKGQQEEEDEQQLDPFLMDVANDFANANDVLAVETMSDEQTLQPAEVFEPVINAAPPQPEQTQPLEPPTRPPKQRAPQPPPIAAATTPAPPLPPKKPTPKSSPTKSSGPATFFKNLFSPTKKNQQQKANANANANCNVNLVAAQQSPPQGDHQSLSSSTTTLTNQQVISSPDQTQTMIMSNYELAEQIALYVGDEAPLATASEFGDDEMLGTTGVGVGTTTGGGSAVIVAAGADENQTYYCSVGGNNMNNNSDNRVNNN